MNEEKSAEGGSGSAGKKYRREFSAGGIVYKVVNGPTSAPSANAQASADRRIFILMIQGRGRDFGPPTGVWSFPKGHMEEGETVEQAALREVSEEAGVKCVIREKLGSVKYTFKWGGDSVFKVASYFLMEYISGNIADHDDEIAQTQWVELSEAEKKLTYLSDKEVFQKAKEFLVT